MQRTFATPAARRAAAIGAVRALAGKRDRYVRLRVRCSGSHQVATVYGTEIGLVYVARGGAHAHGSRDFVDVAHHDAVHGVEIVDLLDTGTDPTADDALPARCECGPRTVSRAELMRTVRAGRRRLLVP